MRSVVSFNPPTTLGAGRMSLTTVLQTEDLKSHTKGVTRIRTQAATVLTVTYCVRSLHAGSLCPEPVFGPLLPSPLLMPRLSDHSKNSSSSVKPSLVTSQLSLFSELRKHLAHVNHFKT